MTAEAWVDAKDVERVHRDGQRQVLGGDNRKKAKRTLEAVLFVARQIREHGAEARSKRVERWNGAHLGRRYKSFRELRRVSTSASCTRPTKPRSMSRLRSGSPWAGRAGRTATSTA